RSFPSASPDTMPHARLRQAVALALTSFACHALAALDAAGMDPSADPCSDFYRYANGKWMETTTIPPDRPGWGTFTVVYERNEKILAAALLEARDKPPPK